jgi:hypothetical protein
MKGDLRDRSLSGIRIIASLIIASGVTAALFATLLGEVQAFSFAFVVVFLVGAALGLPIYLVARSREQDSALLAASIGFIVGAIFPSILILSGPAADWATVGETATVVNGSYTVAGWLQNLLFIGFFGALGLCGGLIFWVIMRPRQIHRREAAAPSSLIGVSLLSVAAAGTIGAAVYIPRTVIDRTCHNPLRDGGTSIAAAASFAVRVGVNEWQNVQTEVEEFGREGRWSIRADVRPDEDFRWLQISLCKEPGTSFLVQGYPEIGEVNFTVYQPQGGSGWQRDFRVLYDRMERRWPSKIAFQNARGQSTGPPAWVRTGRN